MNMIYHMIYVLIIIWRFHIFGHLWQYTSKNNAGLVSGVYKYIQNNTSVFESNFVFHRRQVDKLYLLPQQLWNKAYIVWTWKSSDWKYEYENLYYVIYSIMWKSPEWINFPRFVLNHISCFRIYIGFFLF